MTSLRLVLVGKTGSGKSSAGNTILGKKGFEEGVHFNAVTTECQKGEAIVNGRTVTVVDTPGIADLHVSVKDAKDRVAECFPMSAPGPHAFLLVIKLGRFTPEEKQAAGVIREVFGEAALEHTMLLFTNGDQLEAPDHIVTLLAESDEVTYLLGNVNQRYHVFNNKMDDRTQVIELLNKIDKMVGERGRHYTSEQFQKAEQKRKEQEEETRKREMEKLDQGGTAMARAGELGTAILGAAVGGIVAVGATAGVAATGILVGGVSVAGVAAGGTVALGAAALGAATGHTTSVNGAAMGALAAVVATVETVTIGATVGGAAATGAIAVGAAAGAVAVGATAVQVLTGRITAAEATAEILSAAAAVRETVVGAIAEGTAAVVGGLRQVLE